MKHIVAYCRSACEQPGSPSSAYSQADAIRRYAEDHGLPLGRVYVDPGVSGVTLLRPALLQLMADCKAKNIGTVIVRDKERLSRDTGQLLLLLEQFERCRVRLLFSTDEGGRGFEFDKAIWAAVAAFEKGRTKQRRRRR